MIELCREVVVHGSPTVDRMFIAARHFDSDSSAAIVYLKVSYGDSKKKFKLYVRVERIGAGVAPHGMYYLRVVPVVDQCFYLEGTLSFGGKNRGVLRLLADENPNGVPLAMIGLNRKILHDLMYTQAICTLGQLIEKTEVEICEEFIRTKERNTIGLFSPESIRLGAEKTIKVRNRLQKLGLSMSGEIHSMKALMLAVPRLLAL